MTLVDPLSVAGKTPTVQERCEMLVVGAGPAGLAAATEAAGLGLATILIDEGPVDPGLIGLDVPFRFGGRAGAAVQSPDRLIERLVEADPAIAAAFEAGVDVRLGVSAWGLFANGPSLRWMPGPVAGVADRERSWLIGFEHAVLATGRRDLGVAFPGWDLPGVVGCVAAYHLIARYQAFDGRRLVVAGSGAEALSIARTAIEAGLEVAAIVEIGDAPVLAQIGGLGIPVTTGHRIERAEGGVEGVSAVVLAPVGGGPSVTIGCDTLCVAIGAVPSVELFDAIGAPMRWADDRGGFVPATSGGILHAAGDSAGLWSAKTLDPGIARAEGIAVARKVARALGRTTAAPTETAAPDGTTTAYRQTWIAGQHAAGGADLPICLCEDVTHGDLVGLRPPRYLGDRSPRMAARSLAGLAAGGPPSQDQLKRLTRAGMGPCQGRRCREQVAQVLATAAGTTPGQVPLASHRPPVRPLPLGVLRDLMQPLAMVEQWDTWFGMSSQWEPFWETATPSQDIQHGK